MGQKPSYLAGGRTNRPRLPLLSSWILKSRRTTHNPNPEQPIKFQYKTRRKGSRNGDDGGSSNKPQNKTSLDTLPNPNIVGNNPKSREVNEFRCRTTRSQHNHPLRTKSEPSLFPEKQRTKERHRHRRKSDRFEKSEKLQQFGYEIKDVDDFLTKATIEKPANIPVVLAFPTILYQTRMGGHQAEIQLPLGMVVNAVFKNHNWLYVQTPHAEEGYVSYAACLPLGIIPPSDNSPVPCWENNTDIFPKPSGNMTDTEKLSSKSECSIGKCRSRRSRNAFSACGEKSVDRLYLQAAACAKIRGKKQTLLVVCCDYDGNEENTLSVFKGDVVALVSSHLPGWFWVRNRVGCEGFIPAVVAGHGFL